MVLLRAIDGTLIDSTSLGGGALTKITETVLGADAASIVLSDPPTTYRDLRVVWLARGDGANTTVLMRFNGDSGANYDYQEVAFNGGTTTPSEGIAVTSIRIGSMGGSGAPTGAFAGGVVDIHNYASTASQMKTCHGQNSRKDANTANNQYVEMSAGYWRTTGTAITSITLLPGSGSFLSGTIVTLYGVG